MRPTQTARCPQCQAMVNLAWGTCAACEHPLTSAEIITEPAAPNARPVYWEKSDGAIWGPARPVLLARAGTGVKESSWIAVLYREQPVWINVAMLRTRQAFERQAPLRPFVRIKELR